MEQNKQPSGFAERDFCVFQAASGPQMARIVPLGLLFEPDVLIVKLRVNERGDMVEQGAPPEGSGV